MPTEESYIFKTHMSQEYKSGAPSPEEISPPEDATVAEFLKKFNRLAPLRTHGIRQGGHNLDSETTVHFSKLPEDVYQETKREHPDTKIPLISVVIEQRTKAGLRVTRYYYYGGKDFEKIFDIEQPPVKEEPVDEAVEKFETIALEPGSEQEVKFFKDIIDKRLALQMARDAGALFVSEKELRELNSLFDVIIQKRLSG